MSRLLSAFSIMTGKMNLQFSPLSPYCRKESIRTMYSPHGINTGISSVELHPYILNPQTMPFERSHSFLQYCNMAITNLFIHVMRAHGLVTSLNIKSNKRDISNIVFPLPNQALPSFCTIKPYQLSSLPCRGSPFMLLFRQALLLNVFKHDLLFRHGFT